MAFVHHIIGEDSEVAYPGHASFIIFMRLERLRRIRRVAPIWRPWGLWFWGRLLCACHLSGAWALETGRTYPSLRIILLIILRLLSCWSQPACSKQVSPRLDPRHVGRNPQDTPATPFG